MISFMMVVIEFVQKVIFYQFRIHQIGLVQLQHLGERVLIECAQTFKLV
jgi:hypothetical protein